MSLKTRARRQPIPSRRRRRTTELTPYVLSPTLSSQPSVEQ